MSSLLNKGIATLVIGASLASVAAPAEARRRHHRGDDDAAWAIGAGLLGLGIVAAIASSDRGRYRHRYYDDYYGGYYGGGYGYYDRGYYGRHYYDDRYYRRHRYGYRDRCYTRRVWDPYSGRRMRVRYCDGY
jgi:hypothetical protein